MTSASPDPGIRTVRKLSPAANEHRVGWSGRGRGIAVRVAVASGENPHICLTCWTRSRSEVFDVARGDVAGWVGVEAQVAVVGVAEASFPARRGYGAANPGWRASSRCSSPASPTCCCTSPPSTGRCGAPRVGRPTSWPPPSPGNRYAMATVDAIGAAVLILPLAGSPYNRDRAGAAGHHRGPALGRPASRPPPAGRRGRPGLHRGARRLLDPARPVPGLVAHRHRRSLTWHRSRRGAARCDTPLTRLPQFKINSWRVSCLPWLHPPAAQPAGGGRGAAGRHAGRSAAGGRHVRALSRAREPPRSVPVWPGG